LLSAEEAKVIALKRVAVMQAPAAHMQKNGILYKADAQ
jgi:hypothetical protein